MLKPQTCEDPIMSSWDSPPRTLICTGNDREKLVETLGQFTEVIIVYTGISRKCFTTVFYQYL